MPRGLGAEEAARFIRSTQVPHGVAFSLTEAWKATRNDSYREAALADREGSSGLLAVGLGRGRHVR
jgi:hypothetical protein